MEKEEADKVTEELKVQPSERDEEKVAIDVFSQFTKAEEAAEKKVDIGLSLLTLFDGFLQQYPLTEEQQGKIARLRARIEIELKDF